MHALRPRLLFSTTYALVAALAVAGSGCPGRGTATCAERPAAPGGEGTPAGDRPAGAATDPAGTTDATGTSEHAGAPAPVTPPAGAEAAVEADTARLAEAADEAEAEAPTHGGKTPSGTDVGAREPQAPPAPRPPSAADLRFGVELELLGLTGYSGAACWQAAILRGLGLGDLDAVKQPLAARPWAEPLLAAAPWLVDSGWHVTCDLSLDAPDAEGLFLFGEELVSPILDHARRTEPSAVAALARVAGATTGAHTGMHVHVGVEALDLDGLLHLLRLAAQHQDAIYAAFRVTPHRREVSARPLTRDLRQALARGRPRDRQALATLFGQLQGDHRSGLDLTPLQSKGTVELRYFNGTTSPEVVQTAVDFALALVARAAASGPFTAADAADFLAGPGPDGGGRDGVWGDRDAALPNPCGWLCVTDAAAALPVTGRAVDGDGDADADAAARAADVEPLVVDADDDRRVAAMLDALVAADDPLRDRIAALRAAPLAALGAAFDPTPPRSDSDDDFEWTEARRP